jgi:hypothetical protein
LHGIGDDRADVTQAGHIADGIGDGARQEGVPHRPGQPAPVGHPGRPVQPDEGGVTAFPRRRDQDIYVVRLGLADVVTAQRRQSRDHAAAARVQQRRHLLLERGRRSGRGQVDTRQQDAPASPGPEAVPEGAGRDASCCQLMACDHAELLMQDAVEGIRIGSGGSGHRGIMRLRSDKTASSRAAFDI